MSSATERLLETTDTLGVITEYLPMDEVLKLNLMNHRFYDKIVPTIFKKRYIHPKIYSNLHLLVKDGNMRGFAHNISHKLQEVDFEEDHWRHDSQFTTDGQFEEVFTKDSLNL